MRYFHDTEPFPAPTGYDAISIGLVAKHIRAYQTSAESRPCRAATAFVSFV